MNWQKRLLCCCMAGSLISGVIAAENFPKVRAVGNSPSGVLKCGETAQLSLSLSPLPAEAKYLKCEQFENGRKTEETFIPASESFQVRKSMSAPGWFALLGTACDENKKPLPNPKPVHAWDLELKGGVGVMFSPEKIVPAQPEPADFESFWKKQRAELDKVPLEVERVETEVPDRFKDRGKCYAVKIKCAGNAPVQGYLSIPHGAAPKSLPIVVLPHGAGVRTAEKPVWRRNVIAFEFNAHGIENGKEPAYYENLRKTTLRGYEWQGAGNKETWYFKGMILRLMRALDYVKTIPEWDGKNLILMGDSMGGGQALIGAALDRDVSLCIAAIPAFGDLRGPAQPYPKVSKMPCMDYFDTANFAKRIRCPVYLSAGLIDFTCSPYSIFAVYNALPGSVRKHISLYPNLGHMRFCKTDGEKEYDRLVRPQTGARRQQSPPKQTPQSHIFQFHDWKFAVNSLGKWELLQFRDVKLVDRQTDMLRVQPGKRQWGQMNVKKIAFDRENGELRISGELRGFEICDIIRFNARQIPGLLERRMTLRLPKGTGTSAPVPFYAVSFCLPVPKHATLHAPVSLMGDTGSLHDIETEPDARHINARISPRKGETLTGKEMFSASPYTMPVQAELPDGKGSLLFLIDDRRDEGRQWFAGGDKTILMQQYFGCCGWAYPGETQEIGNAYLYVSSKNAEETLLGGIVHRWYEAIGFHAPKDRPDWIADSVMYEYSLRRLASENGFDTACATFLPRMQRMGFTTLWCQPVNTGGTYTPIDYLKIHSSFGTPDSYAKMCADAKTRNLRILQDVVPHGGTMELARERGNSVFALRFQKNGGVLSPGRVNALAFNSKEWQNYMADSARMFTKLGADGFRIDQCGGSGPDWRRKDWPPRDTPPRDVDREWWERSRPMDKLNPPPFRASLSTREGGLEMIDAVRRTSREIRKDGAVLAEVSHSVYGQAGDFLYDFMGRVWLHKYLAGNPKELVPAIRKRLEEQYFTDPADLLRMRYIELHDGPSAVAAIGLNPARALLAILYFAHGIPLAGDTTGSFDIGNGLFLTRLNKLRAENAPLRRGIPDYRGVTTDQPEVFTVLRKTPTEQSIGMVNVSGVARKVRVTFPDKAWYDAESGERAAQIVAFAPWQARLFTDRKVVSGSEKTAAAVGSAAKGAPLLREKNGRWIVETPDYSLAVHRKSGLIESFAPAGEKSVCRSSLLFPIRPGNYVNTTSAERKGDRIRLKNHLTFPAYPGKSLTLLYDCTADGVRLKANAEAFGAEELMLLFAAPGIDRWQADTSDGRLDDYFEPHTPDTISDNRLLNSLHYEHFGHYLSSQLARNILFSSNRTPLNWQVPEIRVFRGDSGIVWKQENLLTEPSAGISLYSRFMNHNDWHMGIFFSQNSPLTKGIPARFTLTLRPVRLKHVAPEAESAVRSGELTVSKNDTFTQVANSRYTLKLARHGGGIASLENARKEVVLRNLDIESDGGYPRRIHAGGDFFDGTVLFQDGEFLRIRYTAFPRNPGRNIIYTGLASLVEYAFPLKGDNGFFGSYQLMRRASMPGRDGKIVLSAELPQNSVVPVRILADSRPKGLPGMSIRDGRMSLPLLESGIPYPAYRWFGAAPVAFMTGNEVPEKEVPAFSSPGILASPNPPECETFDDFTVPAALLNAEGAMEHILPWVVNPPPRIVTFGATPAAGDKDSSNPAMRLRAYCSVRLQLRVPRRESQFGFSVKAENGKPVRLECQLIYRDGKASKSVPFPIDLPAGNGEWSKYRFRSPVPFDKPVASVRFRLLDTPGSVLLDDVGFFPERKDAGQ